MKLNFRLATVALSGFAALSFAGVASAQEVTGAGASFPAPLYSKWAADYNKATGVRINYQSVGSGAGIRQIDAKTVDFGASDAPLKDDELAKKGQIQFPTVIGGVIPVINVKGIAPGQLRLNGQVLGDIYLGKITKWNDAAIKALNPSLSAQLAMHNQPAPVFAQVDKVELVGIVEVQLHLIRCVVIQSAISVVEFGFHDASPEKTEGAAETAPGMVRRGRCRPGRHRRDRGAG